MIKQVIPCNLKMYAVITREDGTEERKRIVALALYSDDDGEWIWPLPFDSEKGVDEIAPHLFESDPVKYEIKEV